MKARRLKEPPAARVPLEREVQAAIVHYLRTLGLHVERRNVGMVPVGAASAGKFRASAEKGASDLLVILPGGRFCAIEVKRPGGKPSPAQVAYLERVNRAGGLGFVATSAAEVRGVLEGLELLAAAAAVAWKSSEGFISRR